MRPEADSLRSILLCSYLLFFDRLFLGVANSYCTHLGEKYRPNLKTLLQVQKSDPKFRTVIKKPTNVLETRN